MNMSFEDASKSLIAFLVTYDFSTDKDDYTIYNEWIAMTGISLSGGIDDASLCLKSISLFRKYQLCQKVDTLYENVLMPIS